jgi:hypothetical protein
MMRPASRSRMILPHDEGRIDYTGLGAIATMLQSKSTGLHMPKEAHAKRHSTPAVYGLCCFQTLHPPEPKAAERQAEASATHPRAFSNMSKNLVPESSREMQAHLRRREGSHCQGTKTRSRGSTVDIESRNATQPNHGRVLSSFERLLSQQQNDHMSASIPVLSAC